MNTRAGVVYLADYAKKSKRIGELLIEEGLITGLDLATALLHQRDFGGRLLEILVSHGAIAPRQITNFLSRQPGVPSICLRQYEVPRDLMKLVPKELAVKHEVFPVERMGRVLTLGMVCPLDRRAIEEIEELTGHRIRPILCSPEDLRAAIIRYYRKREILTLSLC